MEKFANEKLDALLLQLIGEIRTAMTSQELNETERLRLVENFLEKLVKDL